MYKSCFMELHATVNMELTGKRIRELRLQNGFSILETSELLNLSSIQSIYQWEKGQSLPSIERLYLLCKLFKVNHIDNLLVFE